MSAALKKTEKEVTAKLRIKLRAYDHKVIDKSAQQIIELAVRCGVKIAGPIPLPIEINKFTVNRSTFVHKSSREQFEMRIHKRVIDILNPNQKVVESLKSLTLPAGVDTEIKSIM
jgi:small subunit ribosomal protein S10